MRTFWKRTFISLGALVSVAAAWTFYQWYDIQQAWRSANPVAGDAAIILGAGVWNGRPSPALRERLDVALELEKQNLVKTFLCTGGVGEDPRSEASVCAEYLQAHGVPARKILREEKSASTWENLVNARTIMQEQNLSTALIVTHGFHMKRALTQAHDLGIEASGAPVRIRPINEKYLILREIASLTYYHLGGRTRVNLFRWSVIDR